MEYKKNSILTKIKNPVNIIIIQEDDVDQVGSACFDIMNTIKLNPRPEELNNYDILVCNGYEPQSVEDVIFMFIHSYVKEHAIREFGINNPEVREIINFSSLQDIVLGGFTAYNVIHVSSVTKPFENICSKVSEAICSDSYYKILLTFDEKIDKRKFPTLDNMFYASSVEEFKQFVEFFIGLTYACY